MYVAKILTNGETKKKIIYNFILEKYNTGNIIDSRNYKLKSQSTYKFRETVSN